MQQPNQPTEATKSKQTHNFPSYTNPKTRKSHQNQIQNRNHNQLYTHEKYAITKSKFKHTKREQIQAKIHKT